MPPARGDSFARQTAPLTDGWSFRYDDAWTPEEARSADVGAWEQVALPHT